MNDTFAFAKKLGYVASDESGTYVALVVIADEIGGPPTNFVLYRFRSIAEGLFDLVNFTSSQEKEAREAFPYGPLLYRSLEDESELMKENIMRGYISRTRINPWEKTTDWLHEVSVGGACRVSPEGEWVKIRQA